MQLRLRALGAQLGVTLVLATGALHAQSQDATLWVTLGDSDQLVEVDAYTYKPIRRIKVDPKVHGLAVTADGTRIYLTSDLTGNLQVVDTRLGKVIATIHVGTDPNQLTLSKDERFAYVPLRGDSKIAVVQLDTLRVVKLLPSPSGPHDAYTSADGSRVYVGAQYGTGIVVIDPVKQEVLHVIPTTAGVRPIRPSRDGRSLYVALSNLVGFVVVDPSSRSVTRRVELGTLAEGVPQPYKDTWTHDLALVNDERELWVCDDANDLIRVVRLSDMQETHQIRSGHFPHWFAGRTDGRILFASLWFSDAVAVLDVSTKKVVTNIQFERGSGPKRIAVARKVYSTP